MEAHHTLVVQSDIEGLLTALGAAEQGPVCEPERPRLVGAVDDPVRQDQAGRADVGGGQDDSAVATGAPGG